jgi:GntR family transcriptional repressor for pyruvate dehydrogenase complex
VDAFPGRGTFITGGHSNSMRQSLDRILKSGQADGAAHLTEIREILEPEIAALAAVRAGEQDLATMREAVAVMDNARQDADAYIEADLDFHLALAEAAGNPFVLSLIDSIVGMLREQRLRTFYVDGGPERGQIYHKRILAAMESRDVQGAREAMQDHLRQVREDSSNSSGVPDPAL